MSRKVHKLKNLRSAKFVDTGPFTTEPKLKGKALEGIKYQARVHNRALDLNGNITEEQWIQFRDGSSIYHCRPDTIVEQWDRVVVIESKLSLRQLPKGLAQLRLYKPLLEHIYSKPVVTVLAFKHWTVGSAGCLPMIDDLSHTLTLPLSTLRPIHGWNYLGA